MHGVPPDAFETALRALARRELTRAELVQRLERSGIGADERERVLAHLRDSGLQSDRRAACERARVLADRLLGDFAIAADLESRGVSERDIAAAVAEVAPERKRARTLAQRERTPSKVERALRRKGFSEETIEAIAAAAVAQAT